VRHHTITACSSCAASTHPAHTIEQSPSLQCRSIQNIEMDFGKFGDGFEDGGKINALRLTIANIAASDDRFPFRHLEVL
jgi:hypothetical protein